MNIELDTSTETAPLDVLDLQVSARRMAGKSLLSVRVLCRADCFINHLSMPELSWFEANQLQQFLWELAVAQYPQTSRTTLVDAGLRLMGSIQWQEGQRTTAGRTIQVEPLPSSATPFIPFTVHVSQHDVKIYAAKLYHRLWELFTKG